MEIQLDTIRPATEREAMAHVQQGHVDFSCAWCGTETPLANLSVAVYKYRNDSYFGTPKCSEGCETESTQS